MGEHKHRLSNCEKGVLWTPHLFAMTSGGSSYSFFRQTRLPPSFSDISQIGAVCFPSMQSSSEPQNAQTGNRPRTLDLKLVPTLDDTATESQQRRQKYQFFEKHCSEVFNGLFVGGDYVARSLDILKQHKITHVLNCVGFMYKERFANDGLMYKTLYLQDTPAEDILCVLYDSFDFIHTALEIGGQVLVHCSQGVSRSATIAIAYIMWRTQLPFDKVFEQVKSIRGVASPNIGFTCQLLNWQKRLRAKPARTRVYRIAPHCREDALYLVAKSVSAKQGMPGVTFEALDKRGVFLITTPQGRLYLWRGISTMDVLVPAAERIAHQLQKYEGLPQFITVLQGHEPEELLLALTPSGLLDGDAGSVFDMSLVGGPSTASSLGAGLRSEAFSIDGGEAELEPAMGRLSTGSAEGSAPSSGAQSPRAPSAPTPALSAEPSTGSWATWPPPPPYSAVIGSASGLSPAHSNAALAAAAAAAADPHEVDGYTDDYELLREVLHPGTRGAAGSCELLRAASLSSGGAGDSNSMALGAGSGSGGAPPRLLHAAVLPALAPGLMDDSAVRPESPASSEGRSRKYRRSESERCIMSGVSRKSGAPGALGRPGSGALFPVWGAPGGALGGVLWGGIEEEGMSCNGSDCGSPGPTPRGLRGFPSGLRRYPSISASQLGDEHQL